MKFKTTKSALISSAIILAMCFSMFVGSTYAWFTDSVSSSGNVIQSGTLDVKFWMYNATAGDYSEINNESKPIFGADSLLADWEPSVSQIWEPGKTQIVYLGVENDGNLALKYNILVDVIDGGLVGALEYAIIDGVEAGDLTLNDWDDVVAACNGQKADIAAGRTLAAENGAIVDKDDVDYFALAIHMKEEANNEKSEGNKKEEESGSNEEKSPDLGQILELVSSLGKGVSKSSVINNVLTSLHKSVPLLIALKPFLSSSRRELIDLILKISKLSSIVSLAG